LLRKRVLALLAATALLPIVTAAGPGVSPAAPRDESSGGLPPLDATTSLLVVSPHPDDETLCCAGAIERVAAAGGRVSVVWITSGDGSILSMLVVERSLFASRDKVRDLAAKRMEEARTATALLGVSSSQQFFLGYPDGGIPDLLGNNRSTPYHARLTGATSVPYSEALFPGHPYTGVSLQHDFEAVLDRVRPTLVLAPSLDDTHPDHSATGRLVTRILLGRGELSNLHYWIVHSGEGWPSPRGYMPGIPLNRPTAGGAARMAPFRLTEGEQDRELQAVNAYHTQMEVMAPFLLAFVRTDELFSTPPQALKAP
jgi:LmbE family N-acetylglucosaminyl deacetylase